MKRNRAELLAAALTAVRRQKDGGVNEEDVLAELEQSITIDIEDEKRRIAKAILDAATKPGGTEPTGQLCFEGMDPYDYEPTRLIRDDEGRVIEQDRAPLNYKMAESRRAAKHHREVAEWANRKREEADTFAVWVVTQHEQGRHRNLTFGHYVREQQLLLELAHTAQ